MRTPSGDRQKRICCSTAAAFRREPAAPDASAWTTIWPPSYDCGPARLFVGTPLALWQSGSRLPFVLAHHGRSLESDGLDAADLTRRAPFHAQLLAGAPRGGAGQPMDSLERPHHGNLKETTR